MADTPFHQFQRIVRDVFFGDPLRRVNLSVFKTTNITESKRLEFRAEAFNILNHAGTIATSKKRRTVITILLLIFGSRVFSTAQFICTLHLSCLKSETKIHSYASGTTLPSSDQAKYAKSAFPQGGTNADDAVIF